RLVLGSSISTPPARKNLCTTGGSLAKLDIREWSRRAKSGFVQVQKAATRSKHHHEASEPIEYTTAARIQLGQFGRRRRASASAPITAATNRSCPISTPALKPSSASGISPGGSPISASAPAKPNPCRSPNANATAQGCRQAQVACS